MTAALAVYRVPGLRLPGQRRHLRPVSSEPATWAERVSVLFWLDRRGWPALDVAGVQVEAAAAWRKWVTSADHVALLAVRDVLADGGCP